MCKLQLVCALATGGKYRFAILRDLPFADFDKTQGQSFGRMDDSFVAAWKQRFISTTTGSHL